MGAGASSSVATTKEVPAVLDSNGYARWEQGNGRAEISSSSAAQLVEPQSVPKDFKPISRGGNPAKTLAPPRERRRRRMTEMNQKKSVFNDDLSEFIRRYMRGEENLNLETGSDEPSDDDLSRSLMRKRAAAQVGGLVWWCFFHAGWHADWAGLSFTPLGGCGGGGLRGWRRSQSGRLMLLENCPGTARLTTTPVARCAGWWGASPPSHRNADRYPGGARLFLLCVLFGGSQDAGQSVGRSAHCLDARFALSSCVV